MGTTSKPPDEERSTSDRGRSVDGEPAIAVEGLRKEYGSGDEKVTAVNGVNFEVDSGTAIGLLGPNGAGKTTTIKSLLSLIVPSSGRIRVDGIDVHDEPSSAYRQMGATLEGARNIYWRLTVRENMRFFSALAGKDPKAMGDRYDELLDQFGLVEKADTVVRELSRGQKQKVSLACTMARDADVVFFDEPTLGLDVESSLDLRSELRNLVEDEGTTVLLSSHDMDVIEDVCDRVIIMNEGEIVADDTVENLLNLFNTQVYEVVVRERLDASLRERLRSAFDAGSFERRTDITRFEVSVTSEEFYDLVDQLRTAGLSVESFDAIEPDLEEVFLRITDEVGGDDADADDASTSGRDREVTDDETETTVRTTHQ